MDKISRDCFSIILESLQCNDIDNLKNVSQQINNDVNDLSMIYKKNKIKKLWGNEIFKIIYNSINLHKTENINMFLDNENMDSIKNVIEIFYKDLIFNQTRISAKLFIDIYSLFFNICIKNHYNKDVLYEHRKQCILKMFKIEDVVFENPKIKALFDVTSYINRFHILLGRRITYGEFINDLKH